jgi:hypothetical protein
VQLDLAGNLLVRGSRLEPGVFAAGKTPCQQAEFTKAISYVVSRKRGERPEGLNPEVFKRGNKTLRFAIRQAGSNGQGHNVQRSEELEQVRCLDDSLLCAAEKLRALTRHNSGGE